MNYIFFGIVWVLAQVLRLLYRIEVKGIENLPKSGALLCPNHASDLDPVLIAICLPINYHLHYMAKAELFRKRLNGKVLRALGAFPVERDGADIGAVKTAMKKKLFRKTTIIFGEPYVPNIAGRRGTSEELQKVADDVLREAYALGGQAVGGTPL